MNPRVRFEDEADDEYQNAGRWYEERRTGLGVEFFDAVDATTNHVLDLPRNRRTGPRLSAELPVRRLGVRRFPYHMIYLETRDELRILAVAHDRRRPGYWRSRLK